MHVARYTSVTTLKTRHYEERELFRTRRSIVSSNLISGRMHRRICNVYVSSGPSNTPTVS